MPPCGFSITLSVCFADARPTNANAPNAKTTTAVVTSPLCSPIVGFRVTSIAFPDLDEVLIARKSIRAVGAREVRAHVVRQGTLRWRARDGEQVEHELGYRVCR